MVIASFHEYRLGISGLCVKCAMIVSTGSYA